MNTKLFYFLLIFSISLTTFAQSVRITSIVEGDCPSGTTAPRVIELYVDGTVDVSDLKIQFQTPSNTNWIINNTIGLGEYTDTYLYVVNDVDAFDANFPGVRTPATTSLGVLIGTVEGGEKIRLVDSANNDEVIDIFGFDGQNGENTSWNYSNSYAKRNTNAGPNTTFVESEWTIQPKNSLLFKGICWNEAELNSIVMLQNYILSTEDFNVSKNEIKVYPSPANNYVKVSGLNRAEKFSLYTVLGQEIKNGLTTNNQEINISNLASGVYFLKTKKKTFKIIKN